MIDTLKNVASIACLLGFAAGLGVCVDSVLAQGQTNCSVTCPIPDGGSVTTYSHRDCSSNESCRGTCEEDPQNPNTATGTAECVTKS